MTEDQEILYTALSMRKNFIETGNALYSAKDLENMDKSDYDGARIKALDENQMKLIIRIRELQQWILSWNQ